MNEDLLSFYNSELAYMRHLGDDFGQAHPQIAGRLRMRAGASDDPHVERMIEAFAFLTARIRKKLDDDFPEIAEALLEVLHPNLLNPIPAMSVARFEAPSDLSEVQQVPRNAALETQDVGGEKCRFRTCYPTHVWPLKLTAATLSGPPFHGAPVVPPHTQSVLQLRLEWLSDKPAWDISGEQRPLRFFLDGQRHFSHRLYELIFNNAIDFAVASGGNDPDPTRFDSDFLKPVGFEPGEELLPYSGRSPRHYQLLLEYFAFPEKFLFFDLDTTALSCATAANSGKPFDLFVYLNQRFEELESQVSPDTFLLGCTPVANLFSKTAEPGRLTHEATEYRVVPDSRREAAMEVYSVDRVTRVAGDGQLEEIPPFYSIQHADAPNRTRAYWIGTRRAGRRREHQPDSGTEVFLSLVDLDFDPAIATEEVLVVETTCSNRNLTTQLPFGGDQGTFRLEKGGPFECIDCLVPPTPPRRPKLKRGMLWRLVSHLSLNHLSVTTGPDAATALREILRSFDPADESSDRAFNYDGIVNVSSRRVVSTLR